MNRYQSLTVIYFLLSLLLWIEVDRRLIAKGTRTQRHILNVIGNLIIGPTLFAVMILIRLVKGRKNVRKQ